MVSRIDHLPKISSSRPLTLDSATEPSSQLSLAADLVDVAFFCCSARLRAICSLIDKVFREGTGGASFTGGVTGDFADGFNLDAEVLVFNVGGAASLRSGRVGVDVEAAAGVGFARGVAEVVLGRGRREEDIYFYGSRSRQETDDSRA
jgi:hypothetical protein